MLLYAFSFTVFHCSSREKEKSSFSSSHACSLSNKVEIHTSFFLQSLYIIHCIPATLVSLDHVSYSSGAAFLQTPTRSVENCMFGKISKVNVFIIIYALIYLNSFQTKS